MIKFLKKLGASAIIALMMFGFSGMVIAGTMQNGEKQLVVNGDFEDGTVNWNTGNSASISAETTSPYSGTQNLRITRNGVDTPYVAQAPGFSVGASYKITGKYRGDKRSYVTFGGAKLGALLTNSAEWQSFERVGVAAANAVGLFGYNLTGSEYVEFDDIFITEYTGETLNAEKQLLTNGDFKNWTADDPDGWTVTGEAGTNYITEVEDGVRIVSDGVAISIDQTVLTNGLKYKASVYISDVTAGSLKLVSGSVSEVLATVGHHEFVFTADSTVFSCARGGVTDVTFDDIFVTEYTGTLQDGDKQILVDGDMEAAGTTAWTVSTCTATKSTANPYSGSQALRLTYSSGAVGSAYQAILTVGKTYRLKMKARGDGTAAPYFQDGVSAHWTGTSSTDWQDVDITFKAAGTLARPTASNMGAGNWCEFDDIFITQID